MNYFLSELSLSPLVETIGVGVGVEEDIFCSIQEILIIIR